MAELPVEFRPEARDELVEASDYYRARNPSVADRFEDEARRLVERIADHPEQFAMIEPPVRLALMKRFPYYVPFRESSRGIEILGVCHARRRPGYWRERGVDPGASGGERSL